MAPTAPAQAAASATSTVTSLIGKAAKGAVAQLGRKDGFWSNELVRIALPGPLKQASKVTDALGLTKGLHKGINGAAETAVGKAGPLIDAAVSRMTLTDAAQILMGGDDAATRYFRQAMGSELEGQLRPLVSDSLGSAGLYAQLDKVNSRAGKIKLPKELTALGLNPGTGGTLLSRDGMADYVTGKAADGVFLVMAQEEKRLRADPLGTVGSVLKGIVR